jgi:hypothetical protein
MLALLLLGILASTLGPYLLAGMAELSNHHELTALFSELALPTLHQQILEGNLTPGEVLMVLGVLLGVTLVFLYLASLILRRLSLADDHPSEGSKRFWPRFLRRQPGTQQRQRARLHFTHDNPLLTMELARFRRLRSPHFYLGIPLLLASLFCGTVMLAEPRGFYEHLTQWLFWGNLWLIGSVSLTLVSFMWIALNGLAYSRDKRGSVLELLLLTDLSEAALYRHKGQAYWRLLLPMTMVGATCFLAMGLVALFDNFRDIMNGLASADSEEVLGVGYGIFAGLSIYFGYVWGLGRVALYFSLRLRKLAVLVAFGVGLGTLIFSWLGSAILGTIMAAASAYMNYGRSTMLLYTALAIGHVLWLLPPCGLGIWAMHKVRHRFRQLAMLSVGAR